MAKDPSTESTINKFLARDLGSHLGPRVQTLLDNKEPWMLEQIDQHLTTRIPDTIAKKEPWMLDQIDQHLTTRITDAIAAKEGWMKDQINGGIDEHLRSVTCKILDDPNVDVMIREKISEAIDDVISDRYFRKFEIVSPVLQISFKSGTKSHCTCLRPMT